jgi:hypothetical protein
MIGSLPIELGACIHHISIDIHVVLAAIRQHPVDQVQR